MRHLSHLLKAEEFMRPPMCEIEPKKTKRSQVNAAPLFQHDDIVYNNITYPNTSEI
jgi:hypothetical protein